jgi:hypothetical protein
MKNRAKNKIKNGEVLSAAAILAVLSVAPAAHADITRTEWIQQPGAASAIAVGATDIPWVLQGGEAYYGTATCPGDICTDPYGVEQWTNVHGLATNIAVDLAGSPWTTYQGVLSGYDWAGGESLWTQHPTTVPGGAAACITSFAITEDVQDSALIMFPNSKYSGTKLYPSFWGIDCTSAGNLWQLDADYLLTVYGSAWASKQWKEIDTGDHQMALFSSNDGSTVNQNPWITVRGQVWVYNGSTFFNVDAPGVVTYITDGFAVTSAGVYAWTGDIYGHGTGNKTQDWDKVTGQTPNAPIAQIAYAAATLVGTSQGDVGPSNLWAIDTADNIYRAETRVIGTPK